jgi:phage terminase large subunit-like protein
MLVLSKKCIIDNNPVFDWMMANVEIGEDHNSNQKPFKAQGCKNNKIDAVISSLEALGTYLHSKWYSPEAWVIN